jgi:hypothetical protein
MQLMANRKQRKDRKGNTRYALQNTYPMTYYL